jgi:hypothetical protein
MKHHFKLSKKACELKLVIIIATYVTEFMFNCYWAKSLAMLNYFKI